MSYPNPHPLDSPWYLWAEKLGSPNLKWCEATLSSWISEPANTWSNLLYFVVAYLLKKMAVKSSNESLKLFSKIVFIMGLCSFIYHATNIYLAQVLDFIGMFFMIFWCLGINFVRMKVIKIPQLKSFIAVMTLLSALILNWMYFEEVKFQFLVIFGGVFLVATEVALRKQSTTVYRDLMMGFLCIAFAFVCSIADHTRWGCLPDQHWIQGHALWHLLSAIGMYYLGKFYSQFRIQT